MARGRNAAWGIAIDFAGTMLVLTGAINIFHGLVVLVNDESVVVSPNNFVVVDLTAWGWSLLLFGIAILAVGVGVFMARTWARIAAIIVVGVHAVWQVVSLGAYPAWSLLMLALDTAVIFALTARWSDVSRDPVVPLDEMPPRSERLSTYQ